MPNFYVQYKCMYSTTDMNMNRSTVFIRKRSVTRNVTAEQGWKKDPEQSHCEHERKEENETDGDGGGGSGGG